jgi:hypothetical protein
MQSVSNLQKRGGAQDGLSDGRYFRSRLVNVMVADVETHDLIALDIK